MKKNKLLKIFFYLMIIFVLSLSLTSCKKNKNKDEDLVDNKTPKLVEIENGSGVEEIDFNELEDDKEVVNDKPTVVVKPQVVTKPKDNNNNNNNNKPSGEQKEEEPKEELPSLAKQYEDYCNLTSDEQFAIFESYESTEAFLNWYNKAKEEYDKLQPVVSIEPGMAIDLSGEE